MDNIGFCGKFVSDFLLLFLSSDALRLSHAFVNHRKDQLLELKGVLLVVATAK